MSEQRYVVRLNHEGHTPAYLLKRLPSESRSYDFDLGMPYALEARDGLSNAEELARRSFNLADVVRAIREWTAVRSSLTLGTEAGARRRWRPSSPESPKSWMGSRDARCGFCL